MRTIHVTERELELILGALAQQVIELTSAQTREGMDTVLAGHIVREQAVGARVRALFERLHAGEPPTIADGGMGWAYTEEGMKILDGDGELAAMVDCRHVPSDAKARDTLARIIGFALGVISA